jgi:cytochrome c oxidase assembly factor CtaG
MHFSRTAFFNLSAVEQILIRLCFIYVFLTAFLFWLKH